MQKLEQNKENKWGSGPMKTERTSVEWRKEIEGEGGGTGKGRNCRIKLAKSCSAHM